MRGWRPLVLSLAALLAVSPAFGQSSKSTASNQHAAQARNHALLGFQGDLVSVLAPSADPQRLLAAALLSRPLQNQPKILTFHALITRAEHADGAGPAVTWARLADCNPNATGDCPNASAAAQLIQQAPDNAAVWMLKLSQDFAANKNDDARQDLAKAASAKLYDEYSGVQWQALASTVSTLPPPPATQDPNSAAGADGTQVLVVFGTAASMPQPPLRETAQFCEQQSPKDASVKADCLKLGKLLEWGSAPLPRSLGLHLREVLSDDPAQQQDAQNARRDLVWQVQNFAQLSLRAQTDRAAAQHLLALTRNGGTQMSLILAALRDAGISTEPPADWKVQH